MSTLAAPIGSLADYLDPNVVKVTRDLAGHALFFSRSPIPHDRRRAASRAEPPEGGLRHVGLYAYRRPFLLQFAAWKPSPLEISESLEQLRALEHGATIAVALTTHSSRAVDTPADVPAV